MDLILILICQIPSVNHVPATSLKKNSLVRFRCMLQDTGLGQEMFITTYKKHENGVDKTLCYRYTDDLVDMDVGYMDPIYTHILTYIYFYNLFFRQIKKI